MENLVKKLSIIIGMVFVIFAVIVAIFFSTGGIFGDCSDDVMQRITSPDGQYEAELFVRNCGATTPFSTQVDISQNSSGDNLDVFYIKGIFSMRIQWIDSNNLKISYENVDREAIFKQVNDWQDIHISYELLAN